MYSSSVQSLSDQLRNYRIKHQNEKHAQTLHAHHIDNTVTPTPSERITHLEDENKLLKNHINSLMSQIHNMHQQLEYMYRTNRELNQMLLLKSRDNSMDVHDDDLYSLKRGRPWKFKNDDEEF